MKLMIEISDKLYNFVKGKTIGGNTRNFDAYDMYEVSRCIANGTPESEIFKVIKSSIEEQMTDRIAKLQDKIDKFIDDYNCIKIKNKELKAEITKLKAQLNIAMGGM